jgi:hypothetical protein
MAERIAPQRVFETLVRNAQKGEPFRVKLVGDPIIYEGIPLSKPGDTSRDSDSFRLDVSEPPERAGPLHGRVSDIEWLERLRNDPPRARE